MSSGATDFNVDGIGAAAYDELWFPNLYTIDIEEGDLLYWDQATGYVKPVSSFTYDTSAALTRKQLKTKFVGIAGQLQLNSTPITGPRMAVRSGIGNFNVVSSTFNPGDLLGINFTSTTADKKCLIKVTDPAEAVAQVVGYYASAVTTVRARLVPGLVGNFTGDLNKVQTLSFTHTMAGAAAGSWIACDAEALFGGGVTILSIQSIPIVAMTTRSTVTNIKNNTVLVTGSTNTITTASPVATPIVSACSGSGATFLPGDAFLLETTAQESATGEAIYVISYIRNS